MDICLSCSFAACPSCVQKRPLSSRGPLRHWARNSLQACFTDQPEIIGQFAALENDPVSLRRRGTMALAFSVASNALLVKREAIAREFVTTSSGLKILDIQDGTGQIPENGDECIVQWNGYTSGYQGKRFGVTQQSKDVEPFTFTIGSNSVIPAFEEAVKGMKVGGIRRIEIDGSIPGLGYPRERSERFVQGNQYRYGPQPPDLGAQRALDFVLDNSTLNDFNRTLLMDIRLVGIRKNRR